MKAQMAHLLEQEMDRKDFLKYIGLSAMMMLGGGAILQAINNMGSRKGSTDGKFGYGSSSYGGSR